MKKITILKKLNLFNIITSYFCLKTKKTKIINICDKFIMEDLCIENILWRLYENADVINYILANKGKKKLLNQLIALSDEEQKVYLYILLKKSNW